MRFGGNEILNLNIETFAKAALHKYWQLKYHYYFFFWPCPSRFSCLLSLMSLIYLLSLFCLWCLMLGGSKNTNFQNSMGALSNPISFAPRISELFFVFVLVQLEGLPKRIDEMAPKLPNWPSKF